MAEKQVSIPLPADVPRNMQDVYRDNYTAITRGTNHLFLFSCDHKIEHLNHDFYGTHVHPDAMHPAHMFDIAAQGSVGALATHMGLIARYGARYNKQINYIV